MPDPTPDDLPAHAGQAPRLKLRKNLRSAIAAGHPWIYRGALAKPPELPAGAVVRVDDDSGFVAWGLYDPDHPIAVRTTGFDPDRPPGPAWAAERLANAMAWRQALLGTATDAYRVLHGAADGTPGWAADRYGPVLVLRPDGEAATARIGWLVDAAVERAADWGLRAIVLRRARGESGPRAEVLWGELPEQPMALKEHAWTMEADVLQGQKTGWFLDQRENRRRVFELAAGRRIANLFAYTGGFSVAGALAGAAEVATVDVSGPAIAAAERNFALNGLPVGEYEFAAADAFDWLGGAAKAGRTFDLVIVDPPSFAPNERSVPRAIKAYERLFHGAYGVLAPGGYLAAASCSSHISAEAFRAALGRSATAAGQWLQILEERGPGVDHPGLPAFPEGRYLKFFLCRVEPRG